MEIYNAIVKKFKKITHRLQGTTYMYETNKILKKIGDQKITKIEIGKMPVSSYVINTVNTISLGQIKKNIPYQLYHIFFKLSIGNKEFVLEKNEFIKIQKWKHRKNAEYKSIELYKPITLHKLLHKVQTRMKHNFFRFNIKTNNCQDFAIHILQSLKVYNSDLKLFVKQDLQNIYNNTYITQIIAEFCIFLKIILNVILYL